MQNNISKPSMSYETRIFIRHRTIQKLSFKNLFVLPFKLTCTIPQFIGITDSNHFALPDLNKARNATQYLFHLHPTTPL
ncbi:MAG: hypothetical protein BGO12_13035 [Verrucomicrobia bacterium 61-8]|nr:MAG: hypothetical protein BGO12_13035 [Verrucomicrobia bacterium 61-8]